MMPLPPALAYRRAATQRASVVGIVIALYDTLTGDLYRAIAAMHAADIELRCVQLKHGFAVLTQLDSLLDIERGGETALRLRRFYAHLRGEMLRAQFQQDTAALEACASQLLQVRSAWQQVDSRGLESTSGEAAGAAPASGANFRGAHGAEDEAQPSLHLRA
jgi:flagellar secretion chaperone FliS